MTKSQLNDSYLDFNKRKKITIPYSKTAAGIMLAATIVGTQSCNSQQESIKETPEFVQTTIFLQKQDQQKVEKDIKVNNTTIFKGKILSLRTGKPIVNAKVMFVSVKEFHSVYTNKRGEFSIAIPKDIIAQENVVRVSFNEIEKKESVNENERFFEYFETDDLILTKNQIENNFVFKAEQDGMALGGIGFYSEERIPVVLYNGEEVDYNEFKKSLEGKKSKCNLANKDYYFFEYQAALVLYGEKARYGLYLFVN